MGTGLTAEGAEDAEGAFPKSVRGEPFDSHEEDF